MERAAPRHDAAMRFWVVAASPLLEHMETGTSHTRAEGGLANDEVMEGTGFNLIVAWLERVRGERARDFGGGY